MSLKNVGLKKVASKNITPTNINEKHINQKNINKSNPIKSNTPSAKPMKKTKYTTQAILEKLSHFVSPNYMQNILAFSAIMKQQNKSELTIKSYIQDILTCFQFFSDQKELPTELFAWKAFLKHRYQYFLPQSNKKLLISIKSFSSTCLQNLHECMKNQIAPDSQIRTNIMMKNPNSLEVGNEMSHSNNHSPTHSISAQTAGRDSREVGSKVNHSNNNSDNMINTHQTPNHSSNKTFMHDTHSHTNTFNPTEKEQIQKEQIEKQPIVQQINQYNNDTTYPYASDTHTSDPYAQAEYVKTDQNSQINNIYTNTQSAVTSPANAGTQLAQSNTKQSAVTSYKNGVSQLAQSNNEQASLSINKSYSNQTDYNTDQSRHNQLAQYFEQLLHTLQKIQLPKLPKLKPKTISKEQMQSLLTDSHEQNPLLQARNQALLYLLYGAGLRISEALSLQIKDVISNTSSMLDMPIKQNNTTTSQALQAQTANYIEQSDQMPIKQNITITLDAERNQTVKQAILDTNSKSNTNSQQIKRTIMIKNKIIILGKGNKLREVPILEAVANKLQEYLNMRQIFITQSTKMNINLTQTNLEHTSAMESNQMQSSQIQSNQKSTTHPQSIQTDTHTMATHPNSESVSKSTLTDGTSVAITNSHNTQTRLNSEALSKTTLTDGTSGARNPTALQQTSIHTTQEFDQKANSTSLNTITTNTSQSTQIQSNPSQSNPTESNHIQANPSHSKPTESNHIQANPSHSKPTESNHIQYNPSHSKPTESNHIQYNPSESNSVQANIMQSKLGQENLTQDSYAHEQVFLDQHNQALTRQQAYKIIKNMQMRLNLPTYTSPHALRHAFVSHMIENNAQLNAIQKIVGHTNLSTIQNYASVSIKHLEKAYQQGSKNWSNKT